MSALHDELSSSEVNLQEAARAGFEFSLLADQRAEELAGERTKHEAERLELSKELFGERTKHEAERLELCKDLQVAKETLVELQASHASSKAQMLEAQKKCSEREQALQASSKAQMLETEQKCNEREQALQASSKAQMLEAQKKCSEREQSLLDELTQALAMNKSLKEDLAHADGALYTASCARELARQVCSG